MSVKPPPPPIDPPDGFVPAADPNRVILRRLEDLDDRIEEVRRKVGDIHEAFGLNFLYDPNPRRRSTDGTIP